MYVCILGGKKCFYVCIMCRNVIMFILCVNCFDFKCIEQFFVCTSIKELLYHNTRIYLRK